MYDVMNLWHFRGLNQKKQQFGRVTAIAVQGCQKKVPKKHELFTFWCYCLGSLSCLTVILFG